MPSYRVEFIITGSLVLEAATLESLQETLRKGNESLDLSIESEQVTDLHIEKLNVGEIFQYRTANSMVYVGQGSRLDWLEEPKEEEDDET